jgi:ribosomal protein L11 methyltransferase
MDYTEVRFFNDSYFNDIIVAWLGENDYDMFEERADGLNAYIVSDKFDQTKLSEVISGIPDGNKNIRYETSLIKDQNWNTQWEKNFDPVVIADKVLIRAPFHPADENIQHEIIIEPKMSFGTGHHSTTALMIESMLDMDMKNKKVLDMGCGTGVLAILAELLGANDVTAIDVEEWAYHNSIENCERNKTVNVSVRKGDPTLISDQKFDIILANINRNILLNDLPAYVKSLRKDGSILLSGILVSDKEVIKESAKKNDLVPVDERTDQNWIALNYKKI